MQSTSLQCTSHYIIEVEFSPSSVTATLESRIPKFQVSNLELRALNIAESVSQSVGQNGRFPFFHSHPAGLWSCSCFTYFVLVVSELVRFPSLWLVSVAGVSKLAMMAAAIIVGCHGRWL